MFVAQFRVELEHRHLDRYGSRRDEMRRAAFERQALVGKVAAHAHRVTAEDVAAVRAAGLSEDQIFELGDVFAEGRELPSPLPRDAKGLARPRVRSVARPLQPAVLHP